MAGIRQEVFDLAQSRKAAKEDDKEGGRNLHGLRRDAAATLVSPCPPLPPSLRLEKSRNRLATFYPHPQLRKLRPTPVRFAHWLENRVHAAFFDFANMRHELTESAFGEGALFEPEQVFLR